MCFLTRVYGSYPKDAAENVLKCKSACKCLFAQMHVHVCMLVRTCVCVCGYVCTNACACVHACAYLRLRVWVCMYTCMCMCVRLCVHVCACVGMCVQCLRKKMCTHLGQLFGKAAHYQGCSSSDIIVRQVHVPPMACSKKNACRAVVEQIHANPCKSMSLYWPAAKRTRVELV